MTGSALVQVAQRVQDLERSAAFYSALIGSPPVATFDPPGLVFFNLTGDRLLLEREAPSALLYLRVDDLDSAVARVGDVEILSTAHRVFTLDTNTLGPIGQEEWQSFYATPRETRWGLSSFETGSFEGEPGYASFPSRLSYARALVGPSELCAVTAAVDISSPGAVASPPQQEQV